MKCIVNSFVFQPPRDPASPQLARLVKRKKSLHFAARPTGEHVYYAHVRPTQHRHFTPSGNPLVILYSHGNAENLGVCCDVVELLARRVGVSVVVYDYCGYGYSGYVNSKKQFEPTEHSVYADADCIYNEMIGKLNYAPEQILLMGRSLGGGPACYLAEKHHDSIAGLILQSTFTSCLEVPSSFWLPRCLPWLDLFVNVKRIKNILGCPILLIHGTRDSVVPLRCSLKLFEVALRSRCSKKAGQRGRVSGCCSFISSPCKDTSGAVDRQRQDGAGGGVAERKRGKQADVNADIAESGDVVYHACTSDSALSGGAYAKSSSTSSDLTREEQAGVYHLWVEGCDHNDIEMSAFEVLSRCINRFLRSATACNSH